LSCGTRKPKPREKASDPRETSAGPSSRVKPRQTNTSLQAGTDPGLSFSRAKSQDPIRQRVDQRVQASQRLQSTTREQLPSSAVLKEQPEDSIVDPAYGTQSPTTLNFETNTFIIKTTKMATRKMPQPGEKNAPFFDVKRPQELNRFFERWKTGSQRRISSRTQKEKERQFVILTLRQRISGRPCNL
jgi:hypothetical protein